ncbi:unnamed protein product [Allacma fusca]|uniref:Uncharacterized protein n=1 Tax=Allacma fusca TaxID=39272 RepID=A0A8J2MA20_9HEXA|nr:unnamed protein product [Allacma fusca]
MTRPRSIFEDRIDKILRFLLLSFVLLFFLQFQGGTCNSSSNSNSGGHSSGHGAVTTSSKPETHGEPSQITPTPPAPKELITNETAAKIFLEDLNSQATAACQNRAIKDWMYATNITVFNKQQAV